MSLKDQIDNLLLSETFEAVTDDTTVRQFVQLWATQVPAAPLPRHLQALLLFPARPPHTRVPPRPAPLSWQGVTSEAGHQALQSARPK